MGRGDRQEFESLLARRRIERPYDSAELERDLTWAKFARSFSEEK